MAGILPLGGLAVKKSQLAALAHRKGRDGVVLVYGVQIFLIGRKRHVARPDHIAECVDDRHRTAFQVQLAKRDGRLRASRASTYVEAGFVLRIRFGNSCHSQQNK